MLRAPHIKKSAERPSRTSTDHVETKTVLSSPSGGSILRLPSQLIGAESSGCTWHAHAPRHPAAGTDSR